MAKAEWNGQIVAETDAYVTCEGNVYFPESALKKEFVTPSSTRTVCAWKGTANYYNLVVGGDENKDAVWYYAEPKDAAANIKGHFAFWKGVKVTKTAPPKSESDAPDDATC